MRISTELGAKPLLVCVAALALWSCSGAEDVRHAVESPLRSPAEVEAAHSDPKQAYFGDLHIHSRWSFDAYASQVRVGPEQAYRYARGEAIDHVSGAKIQMQGPPLDFMALTEHGTYMGVSASLGDPDHPVSKIPLVQDLQSPDPDVSGPALGSFLAALSTGVAIRELVGDDVVMPTWQRIAELANRNDAPGEFTSFVAYEYTSMPDGQNLHRNVIFRGERVPARPFTSVDSQNPEDLWAWMEQVRGVGDDVLAIPHNQNGSNGLMYETTDASGKPIDRLYAEVRLRNEPVSEVMQIKGQSETHPMLSPEDEWADFEIFDRILGRPQDFSQPSGSYARQALSRGLAIEQRVGANPYQFGMIGSSDGHNASSPVEEDNYTGKLGVLDGTPEARLTGSAQFAAMDSLDAPINMPLRWGAAGLAGVWARENTRAAIFDALRARETFATSGPRIRVRLYAGWDFEAADLGADLAEVGTARGVPMGGELAGAGGAVPRLLARALKDPREAPLERLQVVKGWLDGAGETHEAVFDIACAGAAVPDPGTRRCPKRSQPPDASDCSYDASRGDAQLSGFWQDPSFDPAEHAYYYVRVLQVPTCRWSSWDALRLGVPRPEDAPAWIQERAVSSPVWYSRS